MTRHHIKMLHIGRAAMRQSRCGHRRALWFEPALGWLERRTLLAGTSLDVASDAQSLELGQPLGGNLPALTAIYYRVSSDWGGNLMVLLQSPGVPARLSMVDSQGHPLVQSDGSGTGDGDDDRIDVSVSPGNDFIEVQSLGLGGPYQLTATLVATGAAFGSIQSQFGTDAAVAVGNLFGNLADLVAPDGIHLGIGDGTFQSTAIDGPLGQPGWDVTAITVAELTGHSAPDIAFAETSPDGSMADLVVLENDGDGKFHAVDTLPVDPYTTAIQPVNTGGGILELAVAMRRHWKPGASGG